MTRNQREKAPGTAAQLGRKPCGRKDAADFPPGGLRSLLSSPAKDDAEDLEFSARDAVLGHAKGWTLFLLAGYLCSWATWWAWVGVPLLYMTSVSLLADFVFIPRRMKRAGTGYNGSGQ